jgi:stress response protein YsnF
MDKKVLTQEELQQLKDFQSTRSQLVTDFGIIEFQMQELKSQKEMLVTTLNNLKAEEAKVSKELQEKYGEGNIDLNSGEFVSVN